MHRPIHHFSILAGASALVFAASCSNSEVDAAETAVAEEAPAAAAEAAPAAAAQTSEADGPDLSKAPAGLYKADQGHRYITFSYSHQGYSMPFLRWREWDADLNWNPDDLTASTVSVTIDATSIDSGVDRF
ncbi:MAG: YceI family protein, partial [Pseudomonadota bacterium]